MAPDVLHVAVLQTDPTLGPTDINLTRASVLVDDLVADAGDTLGLLIAPEIGFGRYTLDTEAAKHAAGDAPMILAWAAATARKLRCHVCVGHVRLDPDTGEMFNSQTTVDGSGAVVARYDKTHLYFMDEKWAVESNTGFKQTQLALKVLKPGGETPRAITRRHVTVTNAICMDINPYRFEAPWEAHELATASVGSDLVSLTFFNSRSTTGNVTDDAVSCSSQILFSSAWTSAHPDDTTEAKTAPIDVNQTLSYWVARLAPLIGKNESPVFVCANRVGVENDIKFTGE